jgi:hypothetical protein
MLLDPSGMADSERRGVDEADPSTFAELRVQVNGERYKVARHQGDEAWATQQPWKLLAQMGLDMLGVEAFKGPLA